VRWANIDTGIAACRPNGRVCTYGFHITVRHGMRTYFHLSPTTCSTKGPKTMWASVHIQLEKKLWIASTTTMPNHHRMLSNLSFLKMVVGCVFSSWKNAMQLNYIAS
jgi:hypothetical protein